MLVFFDAEIYVAVENFIRKAFGDQRLNHIDDIRHRIRNSRINVRALDVQTVHHIKIRLDISIGNLAPRNFFVIGGGDYLVVNVGEVLNVFDGETFFCKHAANDIPRDERTRIADVRLVVRRHAAAINAHFSFFERMKFFFLPRQCVVNSQHKRHSYFFLDGRRNFFSTLPSSFDVRIDSADIAAFADSNCFSRSRIFSSSRCICLDIISSISRSGSGKMS